MSNNPNNVVITPISWIIFLLLIVAVGAGLAWGLPQYRVWSQGMAGQAQLAEAEYNRQIAIREAEANLEAEILNAQAEVARAEGAAEAMYAVQDALSDEYIRYLWVRMMAGNENVIYIPTEGSLPILEAGHRNTVAP